MYFSNCSSARGSSRITDDAPPKTITSRPQAARPSTSVVLTIEAGALAAAGYTAGVSQAGAADTGTAGPESTEPKLPHIQLGWDLDFYMTCVYERHRTAEELTKLLGQAPIRVGEVYLPNDPPRMFKPMLATKRPGLAFKILAAGRLSEKKSWVEEAFRQTHTPTRPLLSSIGTPRESQGRQTWGQNSCLGA